MNGTALPEEAVRALRRTAARARVLVIGSLNTDLILHTDAEPPDEGAVAVRRLVTDAGGHAGNSACALAALGVSVSLVAAVGGDPEGEWLVQEARRRGVDVSHVRRCPQAPTGRAVIPVFGSRHYMLLHRGANDLLTAADVRAAGDGHDAVMLFDPSRAALTEALRPGADLYWTPGGIYAGDPYAEQVVPRCATVFVNRAEFRSLTAHVPRAATGDLAAEVVTTLGDGGSVLRHRGGEWSAPAPRVPVVDPIGAGDAFAAAYLLARLAGLEESLRLRIANAAGAFAVGGSGARGRLATLSELTGTAPSVAEEVREHA